MMNQQSSVIVEAINNGITIFMARDEPSIVTLSRTLFYRSINIDYISTKVGKSIHLGLH